MMKMFSLFLAIFLCSCSKNNSFYYEKLFGNTDNVPLIFLKKDSSILFGDEWLIVSVKMNNSDLDKVISDKIKLDALSGFSLLSQSSNAYWALSTMKKYLEPEFAIVANDSFNAIFYMNIPNNFFESSLCSFECNGYAFVNSEVAYVYIFEI